MDTHEPGHVIFRLMITPKTFGGGGGGMDCRPSVCQQHPPLSYPTQKNDQLIHKNFDEQDNNVQSQHLISQSRQSHRTDIDNLNTLKFI